MVRRDDTAEASLAESRDFIRLGIAMAAMIKMIATTTSNSISENPACLRIVPSSHAVVWQGSSGRVQLADNISRGFARQQCSMLVPGTCGVTTSPARDVTL